MAINPFVIMREVEHEFCLKKGSLVPHNRKKTIVLARCIAMYLVRELCESSYPEIGEYFDRDHATVMHNCKKIAKKTAERNVPCYTQTVVNDLMNRLSTGAK